MASLGFTKTEVYALLGQVLGIGRDSTAWDTTTAADIDRIVRVGRRKFFSARNWKFLEREYIFTTEAPVSTGTVTVVDGVVTLAGSTFPADATDYVLVPGAGNVYAIESRDSDTQVTLYDTSLDLDALSTYTLYKVRFDMPADFGGWVGPVTTENAHIVRESRNLPEFTARAVANRKRAITGRPVLFSVASNVSSDDSVTPSYYLTLYPLPDKLYVINSRIRVQPGDSLDLAIGATVTDPIFGQALVSAILSSAELIAFNQPGAHTQQFTQDLQAAIAKDRSIANIQHGRPRGKGRRLPKDYDLIQGTVDISDQIIP